MAEILALGTIKAIIYDAQDRRRHLTGWVELTQPAGFIDTPRLDIEAANRGSPAAK